jgi:predicted xylose isomerase-like sugar epimerase
MKNEQTQDAHDIAYERGKVAFEPFMDEIYEQLELFVNTYDVSIDRAIDYLQDSLKEL